VKVVGRLAPSPTGYLHLGNVRTFLWAWLSARSQSGRVLLRVEDLDSGRIRPGVAEELLRDLRWLGLDWDEAPVFQSGRRGAYPEALSRLGDRVYPCRCTRGDIAASQSAPHEGETELRYPGTCRAYRGPGVSWRLRVEPGRVDFVDRLYGPQSIDVDRTAGDFVVAKTPDHPAYQLAVVWDDLSSGVTEVVRGDDLIPSTARQILLYRALGEPPPAYGHAPLLVTPEGKRLAKRDGGSQIAALRARGVGPRRIIGVLSDWSGLGGGEASPGDLVARWSWERLNSERIVLTPERLRSLEV
jgi:glutamyl-tRNA synthetase